MELTEESIRDAYDRFSSPSHPDNNEILFLIKKECECDNCGTNVLDGYDFPVIDIEKNELFCEDCEMELKYDTCSVCEEYFDKPLTPDEHRFFVSPDAGKELDMASGIYQVKHFPFFYGCLIGGFESFFDNAIELVSATNIQKIKTFECGKNSVPVSMDYMCQDCFDKYIGNKRIKSSYINKPYSMHIDISIRGMIKKSKI